MVTVIGQIERISTSSDRRYAFSGHSQRLSYTALHNYVFSAAHDSRYLSTRVIWDTDTQYTIYLWHASGTMDWLVGTFLHGCTGARLNTVDAAQSYRTEWPVIVKSPEKGAATPDPATARPTMNIGLMVATAHMIEPISHRDSEKAHIVKGVEHGRNLGNGRGDDGIVQADEEGCQKEAQRQDAELESRQALRPVFRFFRHLLLLFPPITSQ
ncbi:hypothetical protein PMIN03_006785 [Paraphaeosphaeria minitans]